MSRTCDTCNNPMLVEINRLLVQGKSISEIARKYGVSNQSLAYHRDNHISRQLTQAWNRKEGIQAMGLMSDIESMVNKARLIFDRNFDAGKDLTALKALDSERGVFELLVKIAALYHEAKLMELQNDQSQFQAKFEREAKVEYQNKLKLLSTDELKTYLYLVNKMNGIESPSHLPPQPIQRVPEPAAAPRSEAAPIMDTPQPEPEIETTPKRLPPAPKGKLIPGWDDSCRPLGGWKK